MKEIVIRTSVWKSILFLAGCLLFVIGGIFIISSGKGSKSTLVGILGIVFFGFGFFVLLRQGLDRRPRIIIDEKGVTDRTLGVGRIDWEDIDAVQLTSVFSNNFVVLQLNNNEKYLKNLSNTSRKLTKVNKDLGFGALNLNLSSLDMKPKKIYEIIRNRIPDKPEFK
jgi:hypothetical protein